MNGKTHRMFAPVFTLGTSFLLTQSGVINHVGDPMLITLIATLSSTLTSMAADADLHAYKPHYVIWDKKPKMKKGNTYIVKLKDGREAKYSVPRSVNTKIWATLFKRMGVRKHRDWRSHSPSLWVPLSFLLYKLSVTISMALPITALQTLSPSVVAGMGLGYISHIVADMSNKGGIPLFFSNKQTSITRKMFGNTLSNFFKSGNKIYNKLFMIVGIDLVLMIFFPDMIKGLNSAIFGMIFSLIKGLFSLSRGIIGS